jgi:hypothetical protein
MSLPPSDWTENTFDENALREEQPVEWENPEWSSLPAWLQTLWRVLWTPKSFFTELPTTGGLGDPLGFALLTGTTGLLSSFFWQFFLDGDFSETLPAVFFAKEVGDHIHDPRLVVGFFMLTPFLVALGQFFLSICLLWAVRLTRSEETTFEGIFRVAAYAQAPAVICLIPWGGAFMAALWNLILLTIGISKKFGSSALKALFALFLATIFQGIIFFFFLLVVSVLGIWRFLSF